MSGQDTDLIPQQRDVGAARARGAEEPGPARGGLVQSTFLAEASRLLASSLDYETTLSTVAGLALPELGAWCIVDVVEQDATIRRLSVVHPDPEKQALARRLVDSWPPHREDPIGVPLVMRTRRAEVIAHVTDELLVEVARGEENLRILRALGLGSVIVVPLVARERVLGAMSFITPERGEWYTGEDRELAEDLAARCAMAIDNARLYREAELARRAAEVADRAKSQFLTMTSHEIRTPINAIVGYAEILAMGLAGPLTEEQRAHLERIHASSQHLLGLVNEVLDLAKVEAGQVIVHHEPGNLAEAVQAACEIVHGQVVGCGLRLERHCAPEAAGYIGDPDRVRQILVNLLANACKFTEPGGRISVRCGVSAEPAREARLGDGPWAFVEVEDTGIGIPPEHQRRIFDPFVQVSEGTTRSREGSGLGLAIARQLARLMGGDLTLRSVPGQGSTFTLWLPARVGAALLPRDDRRRFDRETDGLGALAAVLSERVEPILASYTRRLREELGAPATAGLGEAALRNHVGIFLCEVSQMLALAHERGGSASDVLRDGSKIQQVIAQLHGAQRRRLGWTEAAHQRDFEVLREVVEAEVRRAGGREGDAALEGAVQVLGRILQQAERTSERAWRLAVPHG